MTDLAEDLIAAETGTVAERSVPCPYCARMLVLRGTPERGVCRCPDFPRCRGELPVATVQKLLSLSESVRNLHAEVIRWRTAFRQSQAEKRRLKHQLGLPDDEAPLPIRVSDVLPEALAHLCGVAWPLKKRTQEAVDERERVLPVDQG